jgi:hypothetical protein
MGSWVLDKLQLANKGVLVGSTTISQYGMGLVCKSPLNNIGRVPVAKLDQDGIGAGVSVKVGSSRETAIIQPVYTDQNASNRLLFHLKSDSDYIINGINLKTGDTVPEYNIKVMVYQGWRSLVDIDSDPYTSLVYSGVIDKDDFTPGSLISLDMEQCVEFETDDEYTVYMKCSSVFSFLGKSNIDDEFTGFTQFVP